jgi:hypothetical protein
LTLTPVSQTVTVSAATTLINPDQAGYVNQVGSDTMQDRLISLPLSELSPSHHYELLDKKCRQGHYFQGLIFCLLRVRALKLAPL